MSLFSGIPCAVEDEICECVTIAVGISPAGALVPLLDTTAIAGIWGKMLYKIAKYHRVTLTESECVKIVTACGSSVFGYIAGSKMINWLLNLIPGLGTLGAMAGNAVLNGYYTYAIGKAFHCMLRDDDINGRTVFEIAKMLISHFAPIPTLGELKEMFAMIKSYT